MKASRLIEDFQTALKYNKFLEEENNLLREKLGATTDADQIQEDTQESSST